MGWVWYKMFEDIDFKNCKILFIDNGQYLKEDLLQFRTPKNLLIDVGWYGNAVGFCVKVVENCDWQNPASEFFTKDLAEMKIQLQKVIHSVSDK